MPPHRHPLRSPDLPITGVHDTEQRLLRQVISPHTSRQALRAKSGDDASAVLAMVPRIPGLTAPMPTRQLPTPHTHARVQHAHHHATTHTITLRHTRLRTSTHSRTLAHPREGRAM